MFFTGHTDAFNIVANVNKIVGISSGVAPVSGQGFIDGGNYANLIILETTILLYHVFSEMLFPTVIGFSLIF